MLATAQIAFSEALRRPRRLLSLVRWSHVEALCSAGIYLAFIFFRLAACWREVPFVSGDHGVWMSCASHPVLSRAFWTCHRPPVVPLLHRLFNYHELALVWFQIGLATLAWGGFAWVVGRFFRLALVRVLLMSGILCLGLLAPFQIWDLAIRSESISNSLTLLSIAALFLAVLSRRGGVAARWFWPAVGLLAVVAPLCALTRDLNAVGLLLLAPYVAVTMLVGRRWRLRVKPAAILSGILLFSASAGIANSIAAKRHVNTFMNVIFQRVLPDQEKTARFERELGMPLNDAVRELSGKSKSWQNGAPVKRPEFDAFRAWATGPGFQSYRRYLLRHFDETLAEVVEALPAIASAPHANRGRPLPARSLAARLTAAWLESPIVAKPALSVGVLGVLALILSCSKFWPNRRGAQAAAPLLLVGAALTFLSFHGDGIEMERHAVGAWLLLVLGMLMAFAAVLERALVYLFTKLRYEIRRGSSARAPAPWQLAWVALVALVVSVGAARAARDYSNKLGTAAVVEAEGVGETQALHRGKGSFCFDAHPGAALILKLRAPESGNRMFVFGTGGPLQVSSSLDGREYRHVDSARSRSIPVGFRGKTVRYLKLETTSSLPTCVTDLRFFALPQYAKAKAKAKPKRRSNNS